jgi:AbrB family looped-hinge helix DNA binding protein
MMNLARVTAKGQTTIPKRIREWADVKEGDLLSFDMDGKRIIIRKIERTADIDLAATQATLSEWNSDEDEKAWHDL